MFFNYRQVPWSSDFILIMANRNKPQWSKVPNKKVSKNNQATQKVRKITNDPSIQ